MSAFAGKQTLVNDCSILRAEGDECYQRHSSEGVFIYDRSTLALTGEILEGGNTMTTEGEYKVTVYLIHGEPIKFKASLTKAEKMDKGKDIGEGLSRTSMGVEIEGKLLIIPYSNIKYLEIDPSPPKLPLFITQRAISID